MKELSNKKSNTNRQVMFSLTGIALLIVALVGVSFSFFNYTRTGSSNTLKVGRISFISRQTNTINLTNLFPIDPTETGIMDDDTKVGTLTIEVEGDTDYNEGVEYLVSIVNANITSNGKKVPISLDATVTTLGTESDSYWETRNSKNATIYKKLIGDTIKGNGPILVGYIKPNTTNGTIEGVSGSITIKAYLDKNKILISDTYNNGNPPTDELGTPVSLGEGKTVFTTSEWNALKTTPITFQVKVEANEGIWVKEPLTALETIKKNVNTTTQINFANPSGDTNGKGLYILKGTENDTHPIYYYRGEIDNNNVVFGGFCWQMVRTTDTGGIKMIYNGFPDIEGSGNNITYNCGTTRNIQDTIRTTTSLSSSTGYYYADDYEIVSTTGNSVTYRLKSKTNPITQVAIANATDAATNIPTIVANYPYTCKQTTEMATCTTLYKVDSYASGTNANVYSSLDISIIGRSAFNPRDDSVSDVGYMSNTRYPYSTSGWTTNALFGSTATWITDHYELTDASVTTPDTTHHYSCNATTSDATCTSLRYVYNVIGTTKRYITLTNGELIEDALYKMTGNGSTTTKTKNSGYVLNQNNSTAKTAIDNWFRTSLTSEVDANNPDYSVYLEDTVYCNDRSYKAEESTNTYSQSGWNTTNGSLSTFLYFGTHNRYSNSWYSTSNVPAVKNTGSVSNIACPNKIDRFTVSNTNGNGALTYPVGLLTVDEIILAGVGGNNSGSSAFYLYANDNFWSLSPSHFASNYANGFYESGANLYITNLRIGCGLRPVVSLKLGTEFETGGDGTGTNPYVVKMEE